MKSERVLFPNTQGVTLAGRLDTPDFGEPAAFALFAHCFTCDKTFKAAYHLSRALTRQGFAVLRFDFPGLGESGGELADTTFSGNVADVGAAARFLEGRGRGPALLIGHSLGGAAVLQAAPAIPSARAVATIAAPAEPGELPAPLEQARLTAEEKGEAEVEIGGRRFRLKRAFFEDLAAASQKDAIRDLGKPLLILHSPTDEIAGFENAERIFRAASQPKSLVALDGSDHLLSAEADAERAGALISLWCRPYLDPTPPGGPGVTPTPKGTVRARTGSSGYRTEISASGHALVADEPVSEGGSDAGPGPYDLLLSALGACTGMTLRMYADRKSWPLDSVDVALTIDKLHAEECGRCESKTGTVAHIGRRLHLAGALTPEQRERLREIADRCPVHRTLTSEILIETSLEEP